MTWKTLSGLIVLTTSNQKPMLGGFWKQPNICTGHVQETQEFMSSINVAENVLEYSMVYVTSFLPQIHIIVNIIPKF